MFRFWPLLVLAHLTLSLPLLDHAKLQARDLTLPTRTFSRFLPNAERLRRGLPLKKPTMRSHRYRDNATPSAAPTVFKRGYIQVFSSDGNILHGYIAATSNTGGVAGVTTSQQSAMVVQYDSTSVAPYNLEIVNGQNKLATYPYLALVQGPASSGNNGDFGSGTYNYAIFTAGNSVPKGSTPTKGQNSFSNAYAYETAVFTVDSSQNVLATWINTNGGIPTTYFVWAPTDSLNFLAATGDVPAYQSKWPGRPQVLLKFVETA